MSLEQGHAARAAAGEGPARPLRLRHLVPVAIVVSLCAACYGVTVLPGDQPFPASGRAGLLGYAAILVTPFAAGVGVLFVGLDVADSLRTRRPWRSAAPSVIVLTLCLSVMTAYLALGRLTTWWLD